MGYLDALCAVETCDVHAWPGFSGYCPKHGSRFKRTGDPQGLVGEYGPKPVPEDERFRRYFTEGDTGACWEWTGSRAPFGYGRFSVKRDDTWQMVGAHVYALTATGIHVPSGLSVLHHCDNPPCVNPAHLFVGTTADNMTDMAAKGRGRKPMPIVHGEPGGYNAHRRRGETPCDACRVTHNAEAARYSRERAQRKATTS